MSNYYSFSNAINIPREADLNDMINIGNYTCSANVDVATLKNSPTNQAFSLKIYYSTNSSKYLIQEITTHNDGTKYIRACNNNDNRKLWTEWNSFITNSDFEVKGYNVTTVANTSKEITGAPTTANYFPVIVGATQTKAHQTTITFDSGKWYAYSNAAQVLSVRFYKIPTST